MSPDFIFNTTNTIALLGWIVLILLAPFWVETDKLLIGVVIALLAIVYAWCISQSFNAGDMEKFSTLDGLMSLFTSKIAVTAGWVHYLAFDLMTGIWIRKNAEKHGFNPWVVVPALLLTFMLGPVGLLTYLVMRTIKTKQYFAGNF